MKALEKDIAISTALQKRLDDAQKHNAKQLKEDLEDYLKNKAEESWGKRGWNSY